ncbi:T-cell surface glycoprotein CD5 isoform X2 [Choloepus didactylus]|uniref:T-cell surface glycoprotein CD5 isoform X2 n=1 Tax=Choloepus didactylus TaxID=27675 RepID=UPI0018A0EA86|nr:T-cell surface glycoprotein CD5 isoform X2 [Choloepus didactylus]
MGTQLPPLATLYLLGMLVTSCLGGPSQKDSEIPVKLSSSNSRCQGQLEVYHGGRWRTVCSRSWGWSLHRQEDNTMGTRFCQQLRCGGALTLAPFSYFNKPRDQLLCQGQPGSFANCSSSRGDQCLPLVLVCLEPLRTTPPPTSPPATTTPEPTAPPRLQLVAAPGGPHCAGVVEFYSGSLGGTISYEAEDWAQGLGDLLCGVLQCGTFLKHLPKAEEAEAAGPQDPRVRWERRPLPIRWKIQNASCASLEQCFQKSQPQEDSRALALLCSDFQPKVQSRLVGGSGQCEGTVEVRQGKQWRALCSSSSAKSAARWEEVCQEQQCGHFSSYQVLDASEKGFSCPQEKLSQCHELLERKGHCKRVFVTCQDPNPAGLGTGTVISIILTLVLLAVLLVKCGPLVYRKLLKKSTETEDQDTS